MPCGLVQAMTVAQGSPRVAVHSGHGQSSTGPVEYDGNGGSSSGCL